MTDVDLLSKLIGANESHRLYRGSLQPLFASPSMDHGQNEICAAARELVTRWLNEELRRECSLAAPQSVRDYLRLFFAGQEYESFVVLFLDAQNEPVRNFVCEA
ncbi:MAG: hypothetical protein Q7J42_14355 [Sulfuritalea sp.]|nr:hypothetical protein [Sulfuritalea sp.]